MGDNVSISFLDHWGDCQKHMRSSIVKFDEVKSMASHFSEEGETQATQGRTPYTGEGAFDFALVILSGCIFFAGCLALLHHQHFVLSRTNSVFFNSRRSSARLTPVLAFVLLQQKLHARHL